MQSSASNRLTQPAYAKASDGRRRLILIRHAKAMEEDMGGDHARHLSEHGHGDAAELGQWLQEQGLKPDLALCSTATRTRETLAALGTNIPTILNDKLYLASPNEMLQHVQATDDNVKTLMLVCHNPGAHSLLASLVAEYADEADADKVMLKFPTSACGVMVFDAAHWNDVLPETATLELLRY